jgi:hypothetical protein
MFIQAPLGDDGYIKATSEGSDHGLLLKAGIGGPYCAACPPGQIGTSSDDFSAHHCRASSISPEVELDEYFYYIEGESVSSLDLPGPFHQTSGAPTTMQAAVGHATAAVQVAVGHATAAVQGAVGRATTAVQGTAGYVTAMHYYFEFEEAAVDKCVAASVSHSLPCLTHPCLTHLGGFGEDVSSDVEEPAVDVDACKADRFAANEADKVFEGENRVGGRGLSLCATSSFPSFII